MRTKKIAPILLTTKQEMNDKRCKQHSISDTYTIETPIHSIASIHNCA